MPVEAELIERNTSLPSSFAAAMDRFPPEVGELIMQLKRAGMAIDENNPQQVLQAPAVSFQMISPGRC